MELNTLARFRSVAANLKLLKLSIQLQLLAVAAQFQVWISVWDDELNLINYHCKAEWPRNLPERNAIFSCKRDCILTAWILSGRMFPETFTKANISSPVYKITLLNLQIMFNNKGLDNVVTCKKRITQWTMSCSGLEKIVIF